MINGSEQNTVLAHMVYGPGMRLKPEDAATRALTFVLNESEPVRRRLGEWLSAVSALKLAPVLRYQDQVQQEEGERPDIAGYSDRDRQVLLIENKFWADLTSNQPVAYLKDLPAGEPGVLLFVCPSTRVDLLWAALKERLEPSGLIQGSLADLESREDDLRIFKIGNTDHALICVSWTRFLQVLQQAAMDANALAVAGNLHQIAGLVMRIDMDNPFVPLRDVDIVQSQGQLVRSLMDVSGKLAAKISTDKRFYKSRSDNPWFWTKEMGLKWFSSMLSEDLWAEFGRSPFWVWIGAWDKNPSIIKLKKASSDWLLSGKAYVIEGRSGPGPYIAMPIVPLLGKERDEVVNDLAIQTTKIIEYLNERLDPAE